MNASQVQVSRKRCTPNPLALLDSMDFENWAATEKVPVNYDARPLITDGPVPTIIVDRAYAREVIRRGDTSPRGLAAVPRIETGVTETVIRLVIATTTLALVLIGLVSGFTDI